MHSLRFLIKAQINSEKYVSQITTLRCSYSLTKAMDGLFKYNVNRGWFALALSYWDYLETTRLEHVQKRKIARHTQSKLLFLQMIKFKLDYVLYGFANNKIMLYTAAK